MYAAYDHSLERRVALKEYLPTSLAQRTSLTTRRTLVLPTATGTTRTTATTTTVFVLPVRLE